MMDFSVSFYRYCQLVCLAVVALASGKTLETINTNNTVNVERGKSVFLKQDQFNIDPSYVTDICQIEVDELQPLSSAFGSIIPKKFPCSFSKNSVRYQHEGSPLQSTDTVIFNIYLFRKHHSSVKNTTIVFNIIHSKTQDRVQLKSYFYVKSWKGLSQALSSNIVSIKYNPNTEFCRMRHVNIAEKRNDPEPWLVTRFWPMTGLLITFNKTKVPSFNLECQQALLMGYRFMHRKSNSPPIDFLPLVVEITNFQTKKLLDVTYLQIPIYINTIPSSDDTLNLPPPPIVKAFRSVLLKNYGGTLSVLPRDCLEISTRDKERGPLIIKIRNLEPFNLAKFVNLRDPSKVIWSFTFADLSNGLIAFQLEQYTKTIEHNFRVDIEVFDVYFVGSKNIILKIVNVLDIKTIPFQVFTKPFFVYTSQNCPLRNYNVQIVGQVNKQMLKLRFLNVSNRIGSFYREPMKILSSTEGRKIYFSLQDIVKNKILYKNRGTLENVDLLRIEVSLDKFQFLIVDLPIFVVRVYGLSNFLLLNDYSEFATPKDGIIMMNLKKTLRMPEFSLLEQDRIDVSFKIKKPPSHGFVLKLLPGENSTNDAIQRDSMSLQDILDDLIYYESDAGYNVYRDQLELNQTVGVSSRIINVIFNINMYTKKFLFSKTSGDIIFTVKEDAQYVPFTFDYLNYVNYFLQPEDITYTITRFPIFEITNETNDAGRIVSMKSMMVNILKGDTTLTTQIGNFRTAQISSISTFTQRQILENDIVFVPPLNDIGPSDRRVIFFYSAVDSDGCAIRNVPFYVNVKAIDNQPPFLLGYNISVPRDEAVLVTPDNLLISDNDTDVADITVTLITLPKFGMIYFENKKILQKDFTFKGEDMKKELIKYKHNGHNVKMDQFQIFLSDGNQKSSTYDIFINVTKRVISASALDIYVNNSIMVRENATVTLHQSMFKNVMADFDFSSSPNPMFILVAHPTQGNLLNNNQLASSFYYDDVKFERIKYQHSKQEIGRKPKFDFIQIWVLENGKSLTLNFTILPVNSQPPILYSQVPLQVNEGGSVVISFYSLTIKDIDTPEQQLVVKIINNPRWGIIKNKRKNRIVNSFSIDDIKLANVIYMNNYSTNGVEQTNDVFTAQGFDGDFYSPSLEIQIVIHPTNDEAPQVQLSNFNIAVGEQRVLSDRLLYVSDADIPQDMLQISIVSFPMYGNLTLRYSDGEMQVLNSYSPPLNLQILKYITLLYVQHKNSTSKVVFFPIKDLFEISVTDGKHTVNKMAVVNITGYNFVPPKLKSSLVQLNRVNEKVISSKDIQADDSDTQPEDIVYTIQKYPENGNLFLLKEKLTIQSYFTQKDVNLGNLRYRYKGKQVAYLKDFFKIKAFDGSFESSETTIHVFLTLPIQIKRMSVESIAIKTKANKKEIITKQSFNIKNTQENIIDSMFITILKKPICGNFFKYSNEDSVIKKFTFKEITERKIMFLVKNCDTSVAKYQIPISIFSHNNFQQNANIDVELLSPENQRPELERNVTIKTIMGANVVLTKDFLLTTDKDTSSDKIVYRYLNGNQTLINILVDSKESTNFTQNDINAERVVLQIPYFFGSMVVVLKFTVSDGNTDNSSILATLSMDVSSWDSKELTLMKLKAPSKIKFVDGWNAFQWTYDNLLVSKAETQITAIRKHNTGVFYNRAIKRNVMSFNQEDINRRRICFLINDNSSVIYQESVKFRFYYQGFTLLSEEVLLKWSAVDFEQPSYVICPRRGVLNIFVIRNGEQNDTVEVTVGFISIDAILDQDFRLVSQRLLTFSPGQKNNRVSIKIMWNGSLQKTGRFKVTLNSPRQTTIGKNGATTIIIKANETCSPQSYFLPEKALKSSKTNRKTGDSTMLHDYHFGMSERFKQDVWGNYEFDRDDSEGRNIEYTCDKGWKMFASRCYKVSSKKMTWRNAHNYCRLVNSYLTVISSDQELNWLYSLFKYPKQFWIGLHRISKRDPWKYANDDVPIYFNWDSGFPKKRGRNKRHCVLVNRKKKWRNRPCEKNKSLFICMKNPTVIV